jgi:hypothetical protein
VTVLFELQAALPAGKVLFLFIVLPCFYKI